MITRPALALGMTRAVWDGEGEEDLMGANDEQMGNNTAEEVARTSSAFFLQTSFILIIAVTPILIKAIRKLQLWYAQNTFLFLCGA
jgi:hypothetical protein